MTWQNTGPRNPTSSKPCNGSPRSWFRGVDIIELVRPREFHATLKTGAGRIVGIRPGDYIIAGGRGAPYAMSEAAFKENYEPADPEGNGFKDPRY